MTFSIGEIVFDTLLEAHAKIVDFDEGRPVVEYGVKGSLVLGAKIGYRAVGIVTADRLVKLPNKPADK